MIDLARSSVPGADFRVVRLPSRPADALPRADAVVSTGHVLNYLDTLDDIAHALGGLARSVERGGILAIDLMTEEFPQRREAQTVHAKVADDWTIVTRFSHPAPGRFDREITVFRRVGEHWRRSDEHHRNLTFDAQEALRILRGHGIDAQQRPAFGEERLPEGLVVLTGTRRSGSQVT